MQHILSKIKRWALAAGDIGIFYLSLALALAFRYGPDRVDAQLVRDHILPFTAVLIVWIMLFSLYGLYDPQSARRGLPLFVKIGNVALLGLALAIIFFYVFAGRLTTIQPRRVLLYHTVFFFTLECIWRYGTNRLLASTVFLSPLLVIGATAKTLEIVRAVDRHPEFGYRISAVVDHALPRTIPQRLVHIEFLEFPKDFLAFVSERRIGAIVSDPAYRNDPTLVKRLADSVWLGVRVVDFTRFYEEITGRVPVTTIEQAW
ncbi:MAG: hypothetical protein HY460_02950, partial [Parcubacteria group bacterium]|nr:hypothetical protein [Parcubacteria group bacterium]